MSDQYRDVTWVASGGYGDIYRAVRTTTGASVAIKVMRDLGDSAALRRRTERELQALVRLRGHPNVVQIEEVIPFTGGFGLVMEYLEGGSLHDRVADGAPIPFPEVVRVGIDVSRALRDAHAMGIVHRDIKPQNLLISAFGQCKVCDFGIAAIVRDAALTDRTGAVSYRYASPEELADSPTIGPPTDVYSFGVSLRHMLTGSVDRESADRWFSAHHAKGPDNSNPIDALQRLIREAVEPVSVERPTAADLLNEFLRIERSLGEGRAETIASAPNVRPAPVSPQSLPAPVSLFAAPVPVASTNVLPPPVPAANLETAASEVRVPVPSTVDRVVIDLPRARGQRTLFIRLATTAIVIGSVGALLFLIGKSERLVPANTGTSALSTTAPPQPTDSTSSVVGGGVEAGKVLFQALDTGASQEARTGYDPAAVADADGVLVVYKNFDDLNVYLGECTGDCSDFTSVPLAALGTSAYYPSVAVADGRPVITAVDRGTGGVAVVICSDRLCTDSKRHNFPISADGAKKVLSLPVNPSPFDQLSTLHADVAVDKAGLPALVFDDPAATFITLLRCLDAACERSSSTPVAFGSWPRIAFGSDGLPMIAFTDKSGFLSFAYCTTADCATFTVVPFKLSGFRPALTTTGNDVLIAGLDLAAHSLSVFTCSDLRCSNWETRSFAPASSFPVFGATSTDKAAFVIWYREITQIGAVFSCPWGGCGKAPKPTDFSDIVSYEALSPGFPATVFGQDSAPVIGNDGRLIIFTWIENTNGKGSALGAVVSAGPPCVDDPFCGRQGRLTAPR